jgi:hypothetical protein
LGGLPGLELFWQSLFLPDFDDIRVRGDLRIKMKYGNIPASILNKKGSWNKDESRTEGREKRMCD